MIAEICLRPRLTIKKQRTMAGERAACHVDA